MNSRHYLATAATLLAIGSPADAASMEVHVDCSKGQSINRALTRNADDLVIQISGLCEENVIVNRERVTLRGFDRATDGIRAAMLDTPGSFALSVRASYVRIENLTITGGATYGLVVSHSNGYGRFEWAKDPGVEVVNCRIVDNQGIGLLATYSSVRVRDTTVARNTIGGVYAHESGLGCTNCTFSENGTAPASLAEATVTSLQGVVGLTNSEVTGISGLNVLRGRAIVTDSSITATNRLAVGGFFESDITLSGGMVIGRIALGQQSHARIEGVTQAENALGNSGIGLDQGASMMVRNRGPVATNLFGDISLAGFSSAVMRDDSGVSGDVTCVEGSNVSCIDPSKVSGASSCDLCAK